jgi:hypothetical protein
VSSLSPGLAKADFAARPFQLTVKSQMAKDFDHPIAGLIAKPAYAGEKTPSGPF